MGLRLVSELVIRRLGAKRVEILGSKAGEYVINIANAQDLGNRSWGYIDFLCNIGHMSLVGFAEYKKKNYHRDIKEEKYPRKKDSIHEKNDSNRLHSYDGLLPTYKYGSTKVHCSEFTHMMELNHFQSTFKRIVFRKTKEERKEMNEVKMKKNLSMPYLGETMIQWTSDNDSPTHIINKDQHGTR